MQTYRDRFQRGAKVVLLVQEGWLSSGRVISRQGGWMVCHHGRLFFIREDGLSSGRVAVFHQEGWSLIWEGGLVAEGSLFIREDSIIREK